jgi:FAD/FMN-containing dehydrogenase
MRKPPVCVLGMMLEPNKLETLRTQVCDALIMPGDAQYDASREIWNRLFDRRPSVIVRCTSAADVVAAIRFAREHNLEIAIKGGGHHAAGHASTDGGVLLDLSSLRTIEVNPEQRYAVAQAGLTWAHFDQVTQAFGLACTGPIVSMTGIAGFTLGGGFGWLHRKIGLGCDSIKSATVVTGDGNLVTASEADNRDLFWGLRGSGWNFGVVTSMEFQLHPIGPSVVAGQIYFPLDRFPELVDRHRKLISRFPDELTTWFFLRLAPPVPVIPKEWVGRPVAALALCHCGDLEDAMKWTQEFTSFGKPIVNTVTTIEYRLWQRSLDARWGNGFFNDWRGHYLDDLPSDAIRVLMDHVEGLDSPWTDIKIVHLEGAVSRVLESETAYGSRKARFGLVIQARWEHGSDSAAQVSWAKELRDALAPYATGRVYANFIAADEADRVSSAHGPENYRRLRELKSKYDPANVFHNNPNVPPICSDARR